MPRFETDILVHGKDVTKFNHEGRIFVEGRAGSEFTIRLRNNGPSRVLAVVSVDGLSVMDGKKATKEQDGYVLDGFSSLKIPGWRLNNDDVANFEFAGKGASYAAKKGADKRNVGVIGVAYFDEHAQRYMPRGILRCTSTSSPGDNSFTFSDDVLYGAPVCGESTVDCHVSDDAGDAPVHQAYNCTVQPQEPSSFERTTMRRVVPSSVKGPRKSRRLLSQKEKSVQNLGTGFGKQAEHKVVEVRFNRMEKPAEVFEIYYDDRDGLQARGIDTSRPVQVAPCAFPKDREQGCEPPRDW